MEDYIKNLKQPVPQPKFEIPTVISMESARSNPILDDMERAYKLR